MRSSRLSHHKTVKQESNTHCCKLDWKDPYGLVGHSMHKRPGLPQGGIWDCDSDSTSTTSAEGGGKGRPQHERPVCPQAHDRARRESQHHMRCSHLTVAEANDGRSKPSQMCQRRPRLISHGSSRQSWRFSTG